ncbi:MAG: Crp/Fnr family transcriptional regulator [Flavobacteriales bacterium]|nr:Crp/Fnr family transcriptional regulator [Flavobacteriales bacterium]
MNRYSKKQLIFHEGNTTDGIYFIQSGKIKVFKNGAFNKNQIVRISSEGDFLGHRGFSSTNTYPVSAEAITESYICFVGKKFFYKILEDTPKLTINLMLFLANELNYEEARLRDMAVFNVREKVAKAILILIEKLGLNSQSEINNLEELSRQDIAELVGLNSNQVTKVLAEFKEDKIIETDNKKVKIINQKKLEEIISI